MIYRPAFVGFTLMLLVAACIGCAGEEDKSDHGSGPPTKKVDLCSLIANSKSYAGKSVATVGRITATKEGIDMWDPACTNLGVDISIDFDATGRRGFGVLEQALKAHGLSSHPVIASVTGVLRWNCYDKTRHKKRTVLEVESVDEVHQATVVERR